MAAVKDHDISLNKSDLAKAAHEAPRPHADGCVGCRRAGVCIKCGKPAQLDVRALKALGQIGPGERCISGACATCCPALHVHAEEGHPFAVATRR